MYILVLTGQLEMRTPKLSGYGEYIILEVATRFYSWKNHVASQLGNFHDGKFAASILQKSQN